MITSIECKHCGHDNEIDGEVDGYKVVEMWVIDAEDDGRFACANPDCRKDLNSDEVYEAASIAVAGG